MGLFDFLFGRKKQPIPEATSVPAPVPPNPLMEPVTVQPGITLPKVLADQWHLIEQTRQTFIAITATPDLPMTLQQSKFGHYPVLPEQFEYPTDKEGNYMYPLAQINFRECPPLPGFPASGYLQFYIATDDVYGMDFDDQLTPTGFRVLFFEEEAVVPHRQDFAFLEEVMKAEYVPVPKPYSLQFELKTEYVGAGDYQGEHHPAYNLNAISEQYPELADQIWDAHYDTFNSSGHKIGGYAYFTQEDPRVYHEEWQEHILLFQLDSDNDIMWGDVGVANFFIHPHDLANKDFSKVIYNWDCH